MKWFVLVMFFSSCSSSLIRTAPFVSKEIIIERSIGGSKGWYIGQYMDVLAENYKNQKIQTLRIGESLMIYNTDGSISDISASNRLIKISNSKNFHKKLMKWKN